jgi:hypothetical protein
MVLALAGWSLLLTRQSSAWRVSSTAGSPAGEYRVCLCGQVDERLAADVENDALAGASDERPGRLAGVVVGDGLGARASDDQAPRR